jgi:undecaprenyl diphosphate synthase
MVETVPQHLAIVMDGNGRWAQERHLPRVAGHKAGLDAVKKTVKFCIERGVKVLTLFAFSSENWDRPQEEVSQLMELFLLSLKREIKKCHEHNIQLRVIGDMSRFSKKLRQAIDDAQHLTQTNSGLVLVIAANYGGRWDICDAARSLVRGVLSGELKETDISPDLFQQHLSTASLPQVDLLIRTSGEQRISNFLLWQVAYAELFFSPVFWPEFCETHLIEIFKCFEERERRFGAVKTSKVKA